MSKLDSESDQILGYNPLSRDKPKLAFDPRSIDPLVQLLEKRNASTQHQNKLMKDDVFRSCEIIDILVEDNKQLRDNLSRKTIETKKLVDTIDLQQNENIRKLTQQNDLLHREMQILTAKLEELFNSNQQFRERERDEEMSRLELDERIRKLEDDLGAANEREKAALEELANMKELYDEVQMSFEAHAEQSNELRGEIAKLESQINQETKKVHRVNEAYREAQQEISNKDEKLERLQKELDSIKVKLVEKEIGYETFKNKAETLEHKNHSLLDQKSQLELHIKELQQQLAETSATKQSVEALERDLAIRLEELKSSSEGMRADIKRLEHEKAILEEESQARLREIDRIHKSEIERERIKEMTISENNEEIRKGYSETIYKMKESQRKLKEERDRLKDYCDDLKVDLEKARKGEIIKKSPEEEEKESFDGLLESYGKIQEEKNKLLEENGELRAKLREIEELLRNKEKFMAEDYEKLRREKNELQEALNKMRKSRSNSQRSFSNA